MKESFGPGGCFTRVGSGADTPDPGPLSSFNEHPFHSPHLCEFAPKRLLDKTGTSDLSEVPCRDDWKLQMWIIKSSVRKAEGDEQSYRTVPNLIFSLEDFDLFIARLFTYLRGEELPMDVVDSSLDS